MSPALGGCLASDGGGEVAIHIHSFIINYQRKKSLSLIL